MAAPATQAAGPAGPAGLPSNLADRGRCLVMGVLNVTPDSFSDGGRYADPAAAVAHGLALVRQGADLVDVGGESTRPGALHVAPDEEAQRVLPVVAALAAQGVPVSIDTMHAAVATAAVAAGAVLVNDVSGGLADPGMAAAVADVGVPYVAMHWRGRSHDLAAFGRYDDVVVDVAAELAERLTALVAAGLPAERVVLDPGLGFAKTPEHNWALLAGLGTLTALGRPLLVGASRKRFLGALLAGAHGVPRDLDTRDAATGAISALAAAAGVWCVRVHDAAGSADAVRVAAAWAAAGSDRGGDPR